MIKIERMEEIKYDGINDFDEILQKLGQHTQSMAEGDFADYFLKWFNHSLFYNVDNKQYHIYNGKFYEHDPEANKILNELDRFIQELTVYAVNANVNQNILLKIYNLKKEYTLTMLVKAIKRKIVIKDNEIDQENNLFCLQNGILNLDTFDLIAHNHVYKITQMANVEYRPALGEVNGKAKELLLSFFLGDEEVLKFMFEFFGTCLHGFAGIRKFIYAYGSGKNGKTTFFNFFTDLFGGYAKTTNFQAFTGYRDNSRASSDLVPLFNKRLILANESQKNHKLNTNLIKSITGGDNINARLNFQNDRTYRPHCKLIMFGNNQLEIDDSSEGMMDRYTQIPFLAKFNSNNSIPQKDIWRILNNAKSEIFNSILAGYKRYKEQNDFTFVESIKHASLDGFASANNFIRFTKEYLTEEIGAELKTKKAYAKYKEFCDDEDLPKKEILTKTEFVNSLKSSGFKVIYDSTYKKEFIQNHRLDLNDESLL